MLTQHSIVSSLEEFKLKDPITPLSLSLAELIAFCELEFTKLQQFNEAKNRSDDRSNQKARMLFDAQNAEIQANQEKLRELQSDFAKILVTTYETGNYADNKHDTKSIPRIGGLLQNGIYGRRNIAKDKWKANYYRKKIIPKDKPKENDSPRKANREIEILPENTHRTTDLYDLLGWFSSIRLLALRSDRILKFPHHGFLNTFSKLFFPFVYLSFSYAIELLVDSAILLKSLIKEDESVIDTFFKDGRASRMANAAFWLTCNIVCFIFTAGTVNMVFNLATFVFDVFNEAYRYQYEIKKYENLKRKIDARINDLQNFDARFLDYSEEKRRKYEKELSQLQCVRQRLDEKISTIKWSNRWNIACCVGIVIGMALFLAFPPATTLALVGAVAALVTGSILSGFGKRATRKAKSWYSSEQKSDTSKDCPNLNSACSRDINQKLTLETKNNNHTVKKLSIRRNDLPAITDTSSSLNQSRLVSKYGHFNATSPSSQNHPRERESSLSPFSSMNSVF